MAMAKTPPMGWNSWNTFGANISEQLVHEIADVMVNEGYRDAGYEYLVLDDVWSELERDASGRLVPDPTKFPNGMKAVADYVHAKGLKFGMYSCAGLRTCAGYPGSYGHEFVDAQTFADWGVDFLKYDYCHFPKSGDCRNAYHTMSNALKATGREILFSACNWGCEEPWNWMRSIGVHMYRSTGDIFDNFQSFTELWTSQIPNLHASAPYCFNDPDMLIVGMYGKGNVGLGGCSDTEYRMHFAMWCLFGVPLMIGCDLRNVSPEAKAILQNRALIAIDQDEEGRPPFLVKELTNAYTFIKHLSNNEFVLAFFNLDDHERELQIYFADAGLPYYSGLGFHMTNLFTGEDLGVVSDYYTPNVGAHDCLLFKATIEKR